MNLGQLTDPTADFNPVDFGGTSDMYSADNVLSANLAPLTVDFSTPAPASYNAVTGAPSSSSGFLGTGISYNDIQQGLGVAAGVAKLGVQTYATVNQINRGNSAPYAFTSSQLTPNSQPPGAYYSAEDPNQPGGPYATQPAAAFSLASLTDFTTPYPYIAGGAVLLLLVAITSKKKKGK